MLPQLEREFLQADLAQVHALLRDMSPVEDPIEHFQFSQRASVLETRLAELANEVISAPAGVAMFFGGKPVVGSQGIKASRGRARLRVGPTGDWQNARPCGGAND